MKKIVDEKVLQVKEAIKKFGEETLEKIVTRKKENRIFYTNKKFEEWLQENYKAFTKKELKILKFEQEETTNEQQETTQEKEETTNEQQETIEKIELEILKDTDNLQETTKQKAKTTDDLQETAENETSIVISERLKNEELSKKFLYFLDNIDEFISIGRKAENDLLIPNEILLMSSFSTSLRISREVLDKFNKFCNEHKNYSKIQILNFALLEFVNKYTKE